jgi:GDPmannose 4,6-dehydratase
MPRALITGITGQDGSYLAEHLLANGYEVHGIVRSPVQDEHSRLTGISPTLDSVQLHQARLESFPDVRQIFTAVMPDECYHLAARSFVDHSFECGLSTLQTNIEGTYCVLEALRDAAPKCRFCFAGSAEMFGRVDQSPQSETTRFHPRSTYGISKVAGFDLTRNYRATHEVHASSAIMFNHESPRRGVEFVSRKISAGVAQILAGRSAELRLGNLNPRRDWGDARDYVRAMWLMLQQDHPDDYVVATGETHSVRQFVELAFSIAGLKWEDHVVVDPKFSRPPERNLLVGDWAKARRALGWEPRIPFEEMVSEMVRADCAALGLTVPRSGTIQRCREDVAST